MPTTIPNPTSITYKSGKNNQTEVVIEPCYPGYGTTLGNALRRVLLSSLPGSAAYAVKIRGIQHEYDVISHVKEDVVEILMNLKKLRLVSHSDEPLTLELSAKGEKEIVAGDFKKNAQVDIINKNLVIATLTDKKAELNLEVMVKQGIGYDPIEDRAVDKKDIGLIQIDSIFSPILNVGMKIDLVRVGQRTDYEKIVLSITTDGTMDARKAVEDSIAILQQQFAAINDNTVTEPAGGKREKGIKTDKKEEEESQIS